MGEVKFIWDICEYCKRRKISTVTTKTRQFQVEIYNLYREEINRRSMNDI